MNNITETTIRAWKDKSFRAGLHADDLAMLPSNPAGATALTESELDSMLGGVQADLSWTDTGFSITCGFLCGTSNWYC